MRSVGIAAAILAATMALTGCKNRKEEPIPGPRAPGAAAEAPLPASPSGPAGGTSSVPATDQPATADPAVPHHHGASGIAWFQGGLEEAFSCPKCTAMFWR
jgi:hypothetical protein